MALRVALALALALLAALLAAPASAQAVYRDFRSPTGKLGCAFYRDAHTPRQVRCDWQGGGDHAVMVPARGPARAIDVTDTVRNPEAPVLAYGRSTRFGALRCTSRRRGITCRSLRSGHGFFVSVETVRMF
jgi:hypothetical protein